MEIRRAEDKDSERIIELLQQVCNIHADIRPDLFIYDGTKYSKEDLHEMYKDDTKPIFVAVGDLDNGGKKDNPDDNNNEIVQGYCFCQIKKTEGSRCIKPFAQIFIDDLCVDEKARGQHVGRQLFDYVKSYAKELGCYEITLNVWEGNDSARRFYENMGMKPKETQMEIIL
ncbi:MAG: GNAT family N-acetyltransferase [Butyrivibrio sp.]|nr:GNAT family N-acetyltransferase [Butyrivibrio sp.]